MVRKLKAEYNSLERIQKFLSTKTDMECSIRPDEWVTDGKLILTPGKKCLVVKKSGAAGAKVEFKESTIVAIYPIAPSSFINSATQKGIVALIVHAIISGGQKAVAEEVENYLCEIQES
ncbi:hypothetical protein ABW636_18330 [Aquimarina sp. 2201CG1-2-11]|uniref:hypothetical protein n=1 Tax=Aquimarina discodermiae TaxID=3231043 RepID=UPI003461F95D